MKAIDVINKTSLLYNQNRFNFDINIAPYLSDSQTRQDICRIITGKKLPTKVCSISFTANQLKANFEQTKLF